MSHTNDPYQETANLLFLQATQIAAHTSYPLEDRAKAFVFLQKVSKTTIHIKHEEKYLVNMPKTWYNVFRTIKAINGKEILIDDLEWIFPELSMEDIKIFVDSDDLLPVYGS